jgi:hypothetical protein
MTRDIRQRVTYVLPVARYRTLKSPEDTPVPSVCREISEGCRNIRTPVYLKRYIISLKTLYSL